MIGTIDESKFVNSGKKDWGGNKEACLYCKIQYMKGVDRSNQYLSYYSILRKIIKWSKKVVLYLLIVLPSFFVYKTLNKNQNVKCEKCLHEVG
jgi:hypothetical protein